MKSDQLEFFELENLRKEGDDFLSIFYHKIRPNN